MRNRSDDIGSQTSFSSYLEPAFYKPRSRCSYAVFCGDIILDFANTIVIYFHPT